MKADSIDIKTRRPPGRWHILLDILLILVLGLVAELAHFSWRDGRAVLNADGIQYLDAARSLLTEGGGPAFAVRKPGYPLMLAAIGACTGNMTWAAIAVNHLLQALLPLAAYGLGKNLRSRGAGWVAAIFAIAQLQAHVAGGRIMSEALFTVLVSFGLLATVAGLRHRVSLSQLAVAGLLLAAAWLVRSVAVVVVFAAVVCLAWTLRHQRHRAMQACLCLVAPLVAALLLECSLNERLSGTFRPSTGTFGQMLMMRTRHVQGLPMPETAEARRCLALLPEREPEDAYRANEVDTWIARYRAVHDDGMDDWQVDALMRTAGLQMVAANKAAFVRCSLDAFVRHLLRRHDGPPYSRVSPGERLAPIVHPACRDIEPDLDNWYVCWSLPHRPLEQARALAIQVRDEVAERAPFAARVPLPALRYASRLAPVVDVTSAVRGAASIWPGWALLLAIPLGLNRRTCALLALVYVLEAALVSVCMPNEFAHERYFSVWLVTDATLTAALLTAALSWAAVHTRQQREAWREAEARRAADARLVRQRLEQLTEPQTRGEPTLGDS